MTINKGKLILSSTILLRGLLFFEERDEKVFFIVSSFYYLRFFIEANMPKKMTIALRGVRISWLILARKVDFRRLDSSARSLAVVNSISIFFRVVMISAEP